MSRKGPAKKHQVLPDPIYGSTVVAQLINKILLDGKKSIAEDIVYSALDMVKEKTDQEPVAVLKRALDNIRPSLEVRSRRDLPGPGRSEACSREYAVAALADRLLPRSSREDHGRAPRQRDSRRVQRSRCFSEASRGHPQDGGGQQGVRSLPLVID